VFTIHSLDVSCTTRELPRRKLGLSSWLCGWTVRTPERAQHLRANWRICG